MIDRLFIFWGITVLNRYFSGNVRPRIVIHQLEVFVFEAEYILYVRINFHLGSGRGSRVSCNFTCSSDSDKYVSPSVWTKSPALSPVTCAIICNSRAYEAILKGTRGMCRHCADTVEDLNVRRPHRTEEGMAWGDSYCPSRLHSMRWQWYAVNQDYVW